MEGRTVTGESVWKSALTKIIQASANDEPKIGINQWLGIRKDAALQIDPATAEVSWSYGMTMDPYGVEPNLLDELKQIGRLYFARAPGSDIWVNFDDLPDAVCSALWARFGSSPQVPGE